jgi:hypothetical protein
MVLGSGTMPFIDIISNHIQSKNQMAYYQT